MARTLEEIREEALQLDVDDRELLAHELWASVETDAPDVERAWVEVVERRYEDVKNGKARMIPADDVLAGGRALLDASRRATRRG
jgi:putative addiction module component (TIGR02574 family)